MPAMGRGARRHRPTGSHQDSRQQSNENHDDPPPAYEAVESQRQPPRCPPQQPPPNPSLPVVTSATMGARWDGSRWDGDFAALRTSLGLKTLDAPVHDNDHSPAVVAHDVAWFAMNATSRGPITTGVCTPTESIQYAKGIAYAAHTILVAASGSGGSHTALVAAATAVEGAALIHLDFLHCGYPLNQETTIRKRMVWDTAVAMALATTDYSPAIKELSDSYDVGKSDLATVCKSLDPEEDAKACMDAWANKPE